MSLYLYDSGNTKVETDYESIINTHLSPKYLANNLQTECICVASSRAGTRTKPIGPDSC